MTKLKGARGAWEGEMSQYMSIHPFNHLCIDLQEVVCHCQPATHHGTIWFQYQRVAANHPVKFLDQPLKPVLVAVANIMQYVCANHVIPFGIHYYHCDACVHQVNIPKTIKYKFWWDANTYSLSVVSITFVLQTLVGIIHCVHLKDLTSVISQ